MPDRQIVEERLLKILEEAILDEKASAARYRHGADLAVDPDVKKMFDDLAADEIAHEETLKVRYHEIKKRLGLKVMRDDE